MIISIFINIFFILVLTGFSFAFKNFIYREEVEIYNLDILYGIFFLILSSLFLNFFFPLKYFLYIIILIGFFFLCKRYY